MKIFYFPYPFFCLGVVFLKVLTLFLMIVGKQLQERLGEANYIYVDVSILENTEQTLVLHQQILCIVGLEVMIVFTNVNSKSLLCYVTRLSPILEERTWKLKNLRLMHCIGMHTFLGL